MDFVGQLNQNVRNFPKNLRSSVVDQFKSPLGAGFALWSGYDFATKPETRGASVGGLAGFSVGNALTRGLGTIPSMAAGMLFSNIGSRLGSTFDTNKPPQTTITKRSTYVYEFQE